MRIIWGPVGTFVKKLGASEFGRDVLSYIGKVVGYIIVEGGLFGVKKVQGKEKYARLIASEWFKVLDVFGCKYEKSKMKRDEVEVRMLEYPAGLRRGDEKICEAGMWADRTIIKRLGGNLIIGKTIASGANKCYQKIRI